MTIILGKCCLDFVNSQISDGLKKSGGFYQIRSLNFLTLKGSKKKINNNNKKDSTLNHFTMKEIQKNKHLFSSSNLFLRNPFKIWKMKFKIR